MGAVVRDVGVGAPAPGSRPAGVPVSTPPDAAAAAAAAGADPASTLAADASKTIPHPIHPALVPSDKSPVLSIDQLADARKRYGVLDNTAGLVSRVMPGRESTAAAMAGGAAIGALIGTMIFPGIGSAIGAGIGALIGRWGRSRNNSGFEEHMNKNVDPQKLHAVVHELTEKDPKLAPLGAQFNSAPTWADKIAILEQIEEKAGVKIDFAKLKLGVADVSSEEAVKNRHGSGVPVAGRNNPAAAVTGNSNGTQPPKPMGGPAVAARTGARRVVDSHEEE